MTSNNRDRDESNVAIGETGLPSLDSFDGEPTSTGQTETIRVSEAETAGSAEHPVLMIIKGLESGRVIRIGRAEVTMGRARDCALVLADRGVSARHARLTLCDPDSTEGAEGFRGAKFLLEDLRSKNGTFVSGAALTEPQELSFGDSFQLGPDVIVRLSRMTAAEDQAARHLYASSMRDALTNLFNRRYFVQRLHAELAHATRHESPLSVMVLNVDQFKRINDEHGHLAGDAVLQNLARVLQRETRAEDVVARVESQDFGILLRGLGEKAAIACAERIRAAISKEISPRPRRRPPHRQRRNRHRRRRDGEHPRARLLPPPHGQVTRPRSGLLGLAPAPALAPPLSRARPSPWPRARPNLARPPPSPGGTPPRESELNGMPLT